MPEKTIRICYLEEDSPHRMVLPGVDSPTERIVQRLKERYPQRRFFCVCEDLPHACCICDQAETEVLSDQVFSDCDRVRDAMTTSVASVRMDAELEEIASLLERYDFRHLPVLGEDGKVMGIISDRDVLAHTSPFVGKAAEREMDAATLSKKAHQVMTRRPIVISPDHTLVDAAQLMNDNKVNCLLVIDEADQLQGVLTTSDLLLTVFEGGLRP